LSLQAGFSPALLHPVALPRRIISIEPDRFSFPAQSLRGPKPERLMAARRPHV
jgi:hypothetical protein